MEGVCPYNPSIPCLVKDLHRMNPDRYPDICATEMCYNTKRIIELEQRIQEQEKNDS